MRPNHTPDRMRAPGRAPLRAAELDFSMAPRGRSGYICRMGSTHLLNVRQAESGLPLDRFLSMRLGISRKQAKRMLDERRVFVNRRRIWMAHHEVHLGDEIEASAPPPTAHREGPLRILYEDPACLVIDKPPGLPSTGPQSVESRLRTTHPEILAVHRLDRETSGCLLFARSPAARAALEKQFEERQVEKTYHAIVMGPFPPSLTRVERPVDGLSALTEFRLLKRNAVAAYLEVRPRTGRTHQIRVHLQAAGYPLAGDRAYATRTVNEELLRQLPRQMLHAWRLAWHDPATGTVRRAQSAEPDDFCDALAALKLAPQRRLGRHAKRGVSGQTR